MFSLHQHKRRYASLLTFKQKPKWCPHLTQVQLPHGVLFVELAHMNAQEPVTLD